MAHSPPMYHLFSFFKSKFFVASSSLPFDRFSFFMHALHGTLVPCNACILLRLHIHKNFFDRFSLYMHALYGILVLCCAMHAYYQDYIFIRTFLIDFHCICMHCMVYQCCAVQCMHTTKTTYSQILYCKARLPNTRIFTKNTRIIPVLNQYVLQISQKSKYIKIRKIILMHFIQKFQQRNKKYVLYEYYTSIFNTGIVQVFLLKIRVFGNPGKFVAQFQT
eukprot:TRINITY_DN1587_c3_g2_i1.p3 TRINITY_DN1587_c3_g2~~TRINITY_DN1587_c3_g2_i1.p3  ORF type:complete len:220 (-),score=-19.05 TRINITY_DN1587_c3_g2_i1:365-1024(-)